jgi:hypothetical protein
LAKINMHAAGAIRPNGREQVLVAIVVGNIL